MMAFGLNMKKMNKKPYFTTKKEKGGSGIGLSIVEKMLFDHNTEFSIKS